MKKLTAAAIATIAALSLAGCNTPEDRALGGAGLGALTGAAIGAAATGRAGGALAGPGPVRHPGQAALAGAARTLPQRAGRRLASGVGPCRASSASA
ncbi:hypothetical protein [Methylobacterium oryzae]|uniref:hypothetical protein n=1 Tax=Methylobacterium oryzae TaxID=334852 RepID=UPI002F361215